MRLPRTTFLPALCLLAVVAAAPAADKPKQPALADLKAVNTLAYAADGSFLVIDLFFPSGKADSLGVWDAKTGECKVMFEKAHSSWERLAVSSDGKKAAAISVGQMEVKVWEVATGKLVETQKLPKWSGSAVSALFLTFSADNDVLYSTFDKRVLEVKLGGKNQFVADKLKIENPALLAFDVKQKRLIHVRNILGKPKAELLVADLSKDEEPTKVTLNAHAGAVAVSNDGKTLAIAFGDQPGKTRLELWDTDGWKRRKVLAEDKREGFAGYRQLLFAPDDKTLAGSPTFDKPPGTVVTFLDLEGKVVAEAKSGKAASEQMVFSSDGKTLVVRLLDNKRSIQFFDPATGEEKKP
jgi:WD40 repeat protein